MKYNIPPLLTQWIEHMQDKNSQLSIRENYYQMLLAVQHACATETMKFDSERTKIIDQIAKKSGGKRDKILAKRDFS